jgi:hypothetical protein
MFVMLKEDRVKQPLYRSTRVVRAWRPTTKAELSRATSSWPDRIPPGTQWQAFPHRLSGFLRGVRRCVNGASAELVGSSSLGSMNECSAISDLPASTPSMKSTSHFGGNDGDEPGFGGQDDARGALESGIAPQVAVGSRRARLAAPAEPAQSGARTPP